MVPNIDSAIEVYLRPSDTVVYKAHILLQCEKQFLFSGYENDAVII